MHKRVLPFARPGYRFVTLAFLLFVLAMAIPARAALTPPSGCLECGNYVRYGYITSDLAGWTLDEGSWQVSNPILDRAGQRNSAWPVGLSGAGIATMYQQFALPSHILRNIGPLPPYRYWLQVSYRKQSRRAGSSSFDLMVTDGGGGVLASHTLQTNSTGWSSVLLEADLSGVGPADNDMTLWLTANSNNLLIDDVGFWVEYTDDRAGYCLATGLSDVGQAVKDRLDELTDSGDNFFSSHTLCNNLPGEENPFNRGWINDNPDVRFAPNQADSQAFYQAIADEMRQTSSTFVLSSLHFDQSPLPSGLTLVETYLAPALRDLSDRFEGVAPEYWPSVRLITSDRLGTVEVYPSAQVVYDALTSDFGRAEAPNVEISVAELGEIPTTSWNHTKIAVRDRQFAIVGGQNWGLGYVEPEDDVVAPIYDLNVRLQGDAARAADLVFERLWARRSSSFSECVGTYCLTDYPSFANVPGVGDYRPLNVFALGRGHTTDNPRAENLDQSADEAVRAAILSAESRVDSVQHQLQVPISGYSEFVWGTIFERMLIQPIEVRVVISDPWGEGFPLAVGVQAAGVESIFTDIADQLELTEEEIYDVACRLHFAPFRATPADPPLELNNHSKFWMVDNQAFYVGSQNWYPSAIGSTVVADLNEFGFMVDDASFAQEIKTSYFDVLWQNAAAEVVPSTLLPAGYVCPTLGGETEVCDGVDNDLDDAIDENNVCGCVERSYDGNTYAFCATTVPWDDAKSACQARDANLVKIEDAAENAWVESQGVPPDSWLGLSDGGLEGYWRWTDGSLADQIYTNWSTSEPNGSSNENCVNMSSGGTWNDLPCSWDLPFICEAAGATGQRACATGNLVYDDIQGCLTGPVRVPLDLLVEDGVGGWDPVGTVTPDFFGRFCVNLDWGPTYRVEAFEEQCFGYRRRCDATLRRQDPAAIGFCGDSDPGCEDLDEIDFFCES